MRLTEIVGNNLRAMRESASATQDEVARSARAVGLPWARSTVAQVELGTKRLSAEELLMLPALVFAAFDQDVTVGALLLPHGAAGGDPWVSLSDDTRARASDLSANLSGGDLLDALDTPTARRASDLTKQGAAMLTRARVIWPAAKGRQIVEAEADAALDAEQKAARKLGRPAWEVALMAQRLWGHGLTVERDRRVGADLGARSQQAKRGHVTRQLLSDLEEAFGGITHGSN